MQLCPIHDEAWDHDALRMYTGPKRGQLAGQAGQGRRGEMFGWVKWKIFQLYVDNSPRALHIDLHICSLTSVIIHGSHCSLSLARRAMHSETVMFSK